MKKLLILFVLLAGCATPRIAPRDVTDMILAYEDDMWETSKVWEWHPDTHKEPYCTKDRLPYLIKVRVFAPTEETKNLNGLYDPGRQTIHIKLDAEKTMRRRFVWEWIRALQVCTRTIDWGCPNGKECYASMPGYLFRDPTSVYRITIKRLGLLSEEGD